MSNEVGSFTVKGWAVIPVILLVLAVMGFQYYSAQTPVDDSTRARIEAAIAAEYMGDKLSEKEEGQLARDDIAEQRKFVDELLRRGKVEIVSIDMRGAGDDCVARVEFTVDGGPPPDGDPLRYYRMRHSNLTGWSLGPETTSWSYHLAFL